MGDRILFPVLDSGHLPLTTPHAQPMDINPRYAIATALLLFAGCQALKQPLEPPRQASALPYPSPVQPIPPQPIAQPVQVTEDNPSLETCQMFYEFGGQDEACDRVLAQHEFSSQPTQPAPQQPATASAWQWPTLDKQNPGITSGFGKRIHPVTGKESFHAGIDLLIPYNQGVTAARSGTVIESRNAGTCGNMVIIDHGDYETKYCHLSEIWARKGIHVEAGDTIGLCGSTGQSTGPHLHLEVISKASGKAVNPMEVLP